MAIKNFLKQQNLDWSVFIFEILDVIFFIWFNCQKNSLNHSSFIIIEFYFWWSRWLFFVVFEKEKKAQKFGKTFDNIYNNFNISINDEKSNEIVLIIFWYSNSIFYKCKLDN